MIEKEGAKCLCMPVDLAEGDAAAKRIVDETVNAWGKIDILINNAAIQNVHPSVTDTDPKVLEETFKVNIFSMFYLAKYAVPHMPRGSAIINSTSVTAYNGSPSLLEYSATKGAIVTFTRSLAKQVRRECCPFTMRCCDKVITWANIVVFVLGACSWVQRESVSTPSLLAR
jgi:NAD(P)-dependent dehydrogenase (short-subunit alcohol dehydrogenase family)